MNICCQKSFSVTIVQLSSLIFKIAAVCDNTIIGNSDKVVDECNK